MATSWCPPSWCISGGVCAACLPPLVSPLTFLSGCLQGHPPELLCGLPQAKRHWGAAVETRQPESAKNLSC